MAACRVVSCGLRTMVGTKVLFVIDNCIATTFLRPQINWPLSRVVAKYARPMAHRHPPTAQRAQKPPNTSNFARNATKTTQPKDIGRKTFQPIRISWS